MRIRHESGRSVLLPRTRPTTLRMVWVAHGANNTGSALLRTDQPYYNVIPDQLHTPLLASDNGGASTYGNDTAIAALDANWTWMSTALLGVSTDKVVLFGGSMGCQVNANWARANKTKVAAIVNVIGIPDVEAARAANRAGVDQAAVETAYTNNAGWQAARPTHNPQEYAAADLSGFPILDFYSDDDPHSTPTEHLAYKAACGSSCTTVSMGSQGHTFNGLDIERMRDFIALYLS